MRAVVLLNAKKEQIISSYAEIHGIDFPESGAMPKSLQWSGRSFVFMDQPTHETDHEGAELFRFIEKA